jgi:hypothetical protein
MKNEINSYKKLNGLYASNSNRWLNCTASAYLYHKHHDEIIANTPKSSYAEKGKKFHEFAEYLAYKAFLDITGESNKDNNGYYEDRILKEDDDIYAGAKAYISYVDTHTSLCDQFYIEKKFYLNDIGLSGTPDIATYDHYKNSISIFDLKTGQIIVDVVDNTQLLIYALAFYNYVNENFIESKIDLINLHIIQPSIDNYQTVQITKDQLINGFRPRLYNKIHEIRNAPKFNPKFKSCNYCYFKLRCKSYKEEFKKVLNMESLINEKQELQDISEKEISLIINNKKYINDYIKQIEEHAKTQILKGHNISGVKLVQKITRRAWVDEDNTIETLSSNFTEDEIFTKKLISVSALEQKVGKKVFKETYANLTYKPKGEYAVVSIDDRRKKAEAPEIIDNEFYGFLSVVK